MNSKLMRRTRPLLALTVLSFVLAIGAVQPRPRNPEPPREERVIAGVIVVKFRSSVPAAASGILSSGLTARLQIRGVQSMKQAFPDVRALARSNPMAQSGLDRIFFATVPGSADVRQIAARLSRLPEVEYAEPKYLQTLYETPNDPYFSSIQASYFSLMHVPDAWSTVKTNSSVIVADVDGGTYWQHEDIRPNIWGDTATKNVGWNFATSTGNPNGSASTPISYSHGTATASLVAAATNNGVGMAGSAWNCVLMPINSASTVIDNAIEFGYEGSQFAAAHGAKVISCSWGRTGSYSQFEHDVVTAATASGALIVAAAANASTNNDLVPNYPSSFPGVLGVGATLSSGPTIADFTNYGISVPVYAPGVSIFGAIVGGGYGIIGSGTSFSTPLTAGLAALLFTQHPDWTPGQVAAQIRVTADPLDVANPSYAGVIGHGMVDFSRAVTETHPGLEITGDTAIVSSRQEYIIPGDTVRISIKVKNILPLTAANVQFTLTSSDGAVQVLGGTAGVTSIPQGTEVALPDFVVRADTITGSRTVILALRWVSDGGNTDAVAIPLLIFSQAPRWKLHDTPAPSPLYSVKAVTSSVLWASGGDGAQTDPGVVRSVDGGATWSLATGNLTNVDLYCITATDSSHAWVGTSDGRIFATTNGGTSWSAQTYPGTQSPFIDGIWFFDNLNGRALGDPPGGSNARFVILTTSNGGQTWTHVQSEPNGTLSEAGWNNSWWWTDPLHGWFGTNHNKTWRTTDGGSTWASGLTSGSNSVGVSFGDQLHGVAVFDDGTASTSSDGGATWSAGSTVGASLTSVAFVPATAFVWVSGPFTPYSSSDTGRSWTPETTYPFDGSIDHVSVIDESHAWGATSFGQILSYISGGPSGPGGPTGGDSTAYALFQNFPNPFNSSTVISYQLPLSSNVTLSVYDLLGRRVATLATGTEQSGPVRVVWSPRDNASGVYFVRLEAVPLDGSRGKFTQTRKLLYLK